MSVAESQPTAEPSAAQYKFRLLSDAASQTHNPHIVFFQSPSQDFVTELFQTAFTCGKNPVPLTVQVIPSLCLGGSLDFCRVVSTVHHFLWPCAETHKLTPLNLQEKCAEMMELPRPEVWSWPHFYSVAFLRIVSLVGCSCQVAHMVYVGG